MAEVVANIEMAESPAAGWTDLEFSERAERHRRELHVHCYRMLGSFDEAEDAVQEVLLQGWRRRADLERPEQLRAWLYKIATNRCLDHLRASRRRPVTVTSFRDVPWLEPYPDRLLAEVAPSSAGDVLDWPATGVAELLELSVPAVNSALQRARGTLRTALPVHKREDWTRDRPSTVDADVLARYIAAYETGDTDATLALLTDDIRVTMPPAPYLFVGIDAVRGLADRARVTGEWRLVATGANGQPAAACYLRDPGEQKFRAFKIDVLDVADGGRISAITTFGVKHFPAFDLPAVLP